MTKKHRRHILSIDVGGTHVKLRVSNHRAIKVFSSSNALTARELVNAVRKAAEGWDYHYVSIGFPGVVVEGRIVNEPANLGHGWVGFDFAKAFERPTRIFNDAVMQALGSYRGGRMLFLGFGTALGAVAILRSRIYPLELAHLPFSKRGQIQDYVGADALRRLGRKRWSANAIKLLNHLGRTLDAQYIVVGGGNAVRLTRLPRKALLGDNALAFIGGFRAWRTPLHDRGQGL